MSVSTQTRQQEEERQETQEHLDLIQRRRKEIERKHEILLSDLGLHAEFVDEYVEGITDSRAYQDIKAALIKIWRLGDRPWALFATAIDSIQDDEAKAAVLIEWMKTQQISIQETTKVIIDVAGRFERSIENATNPVRVAKEKLRNLLKRNK